MHEDWLTEGVLAVRRRAGRRLGGEGRFHGDGAMRTLPSPRAKGTGASPLRRKDLSLSRQSVYGAALPPLSLRPLSRRSG
jgi:hypothetical protein